MLFRRNKKDIQWREQPGCFELRLKRRYNNPIFPIGSRKVTQRDLLKAREKDDQGFDQIKTEVLSYLKELSQKLKSESGTNYNDCIKYILKIDSLIERVVEIGGATNSIIDNLFALRKTIVDDSYEALANNEEAQTYLRLQKAEQFNNLGYNIITTNVFARQMLRKDDPLKHEAIVYSLLSEDYETMLSILVGLDEEPRNSFLSFCAMRIKEMESELQGNNDQLISNLINKLEMVTKFYNK